MINLKAIKISEELLQKTLSKGGLKNKLAAQMVLCSEHVVKGDYRRGRGSLLRYQSKQPVINSL